MDEAKYRWVDTQVRDILKTNRYDREEKRRRIMDLYYMGCANAYDVGKKDGVLEAIKANSGVKDEKAD